MKVNLVVNSFPTPSETFLFNLVVGLESKGVDVTVIASSPSAYNNFYENRQLEWSGKIRYIPGKKATDLIKWIFIFFKHIKLFFALNRAVGLKKAIGLCAAYDAFMHNRPDIVHFSFSGIAIQYQYIISELNKYCKTVLSCRGTGEKVKPVVDKARGVQLASVLNKVIMVHCVSEDMLHTISQYADVKHKSFINYPSIQIERFTFKVNHTRSSSEAFEIVTTGRLYYQKGYVFALEALHKLSKAGYRFHYHILGEGPDREMLEYTIHDMKLTNSVTLHGRVDGEKVKHYLSIANIFLLPSVYEGISNAVLEAMCIGVPIVTTAAGGMAEVIEDEVNGRIVQTYNSQAIYEAIKWTIENYEKSIHMAVKARETIVDKHTHERQIGVFVNHYKQIKL